MTTSTLTPDTPNVPDTDTNENTTAQLPTTQLPTTQLPPAQPASGQPASPASPHYSYPPVRPTNVLGIVTLVLGVLGFAIVPVITGHIALAQIKRTGDDGRGITIAGLVLGYIALAGYVFAALLFFGTLFLGFIGAVSSYR
ncbi:DUF4190 domain-containing protein [Agreia sp. VKM Ac-1783]|uniref:DUF4190 domain-containing protein n=1 Tax=Agreia sp. VKM Ac-1783 TaxID=1938889 RepID=UPI000A2AE449|nr:DUF4190 domain-containing protein [Agreia sp. VKM Ac-1783]SMQ58806.1 protein of unknown function [Agreia sp. VKM Ac-1783]